ncbi:MAG: hypothetical protein Q8R08_00120 [bacterium]|nr:hypothetical protein [bacterium]
MTPLSADQLEITPDSMREMLLAGAVIRCTLNSHVSLGRKFVTIQMYFAISDGEDSLSVFRLVYQDVIPSDPRQAARCFIAPLGNPSNECLAKEIATWPKIHSRNKQHVGMKAIGVDDWREIPIAVAEIRENFLGLKAALAALMRQNVRETHIPMLTAYSLVEVFINS